MTAATPEPGRTAQGHTWEYLLRSRRDLDVPKGRRAPGAARLVRGPRSPARRTNAAADAVTDAGVLPVIAAGNSAKGACLVSPALAGKVLTVAAGNRYDEETDFSNWGWELFVDWLTLVSDSAFGWVSLRSGV